MEASHISFTQSSKRKRMLVIAGKAFYKNKSSEITFESPDDGRDCKGQKVYWSCRSSSCGATAISIEDSYGKELEVRECKDHDQSICTEGRRNVVVVKFGGSAITDKSKLETLKEVSLETSCAQIKEVLDRGGSVVVVHGAGSFGHFQAKQYGLSKGGRAADWREGLACTRRSVLRLNGLVCDSLISHGVPCGALPPFALVQYKDGVDISIPSLTEAIASLLDSGLVPVTHGDVVLDSSRRCAVMSGDVIINQLCESDCTVRPQSVVFLTDVAGVFDMPPSHPLAALIPRIPVQADGSFVLPYIEDAAHPDVTGGMRGKLQEAAKIASRGVPVFIVECGSVHAAVAMGGGRPTVGTVIELENV